MTVLLLQKKYLPICYINKSICPKYYTYISLIFFRITVEQKLRSECIGNFGSRWYYHRDPLTCDTSVRPNLGRGGSQSVLGNLGSRWYHRDPLTCDTSVGPNLTTTATQLMCQHVMGPKIPFFFVF